MHFRFIPRRQYCLPVVAHSEPRTVQTSFLVVLAVFAAAAQHHHSFCLHNRLRFSPCSHEERSVAHAQWILASFPMPLHSLRIGQGRKLWCPQACESACPPFRGTKYPLPLIHFFTPHNPCSLHRTGHACVRTLFPFSGSGGNGLRAAPRTGVDEPQTDRQNKNNHRK